MNKIVGAAFALGISVMGAQAGTIDFEGVSDGLNADLGNGFIAEDIRIVSGPCASGDCAALNQNGPRGTGLDLMTIRQADFSAFTITSFWYERIGSPSAITVETSAGANITYDSGNSGHNTGTVIDTSLNALFMDIISISFENTGTGNIRVDDIVFADAPVVPLPAAGWMLLAGVGGLAAAGRRKSKKG